MQALPSLARTHRPGPQARGRVAAHDERGLRPVRLLTAATLMVACGGPAAPRPAPPPTAAPVAVAAEAPPPPPFAPLPAVGSNAALRLDMRTFRTTMCACTDHACVDAVSVDMRRTLNNRGTAGVEPIDEPTRDEVATLTAEMTACAQRLTPAVAAPSSQLPAECVAYLAEIEQLVQCERMPAESREQLRVSVEQVRQTWANVPAEAHAAMAAACKQGADAVRSSRRSNSCP